MIPTIPIALTAAPATAAIATTGLEPLLWLTVGLMATAALLVFREARTQGSVSRGQSIADGPARVRLQLVPRASKPVLDAA